MSSAQENSTSEPLCSKTTAPTNDSCSLGIWPLFVWMFFVTTYSHGVIDGLSAKVNTYLVIAVFMVVIAAFYKESRMQAAGRIIDIASAGAMSVGTAILLFAHQAPSPLLWFTVSTTLCGAGCAWGYARWGAFFSSLDTRQAAICLFEATIVGSLLKPMLSFLPGSVACGICALLPILSALFYARIGIQDVNPTKTAVLYRTSGDYLTFWKMALCIAFTTIIISFVNKVAISSQYAIDPSLLTASIGIARLLNALLLLCIIVWIKRFNGSFGFTQLWDIVLLFTALSILCLAFGSTAVLGYMLIGVCIDFVVTFLWLALTDIAHHSEASPYAVFALGWALYASSRYMGSLLTSYGLFTVPSALNPSYCLVLMSLLFVVALFCLGTRNPYISRIFSDLDDSAPAETEYSLIDERCRVVAATYGLTEREREVMELLAKGRSKAYIAESIYISENTVRSHARNIYSKLGIHRKDELQKVIGI